MNRRGRYIGCSQCSIMADGGGGAGHTDADLRSGARMRAARRQPPGTPARLLEQGRRRGKDCCCRQLRQAVQVWCTDAGYIGRSMWRVDMWTCGHAVMQDTSHGMGMRSTSQAGCSAMQYVTCASIWHAACGNAATYIHRARGPQHGGRLQVTITLLGIYFALDCYLSVWPSAPATIVGIGCCVT